LLSAPHAGAEPQLSPPPQDPFSKHAWPAPPTLPQQGDQPPAHPDDQVMQVSPELQVSRVEVPVEE
jgi:hypothetical protein